MIINDSLKANSSISSHLKKNSLCKAINVTLGRNIKTFQILIRNIPLIIYHVSVQLLTISTFVTSVKGHWIFRTSRNFKISQVISYQQITKMLIYKCFGFLHEEMRLCQVYTCLFFSISPKKGHITYISFHLLVTNFLILPVG